MRPAGPSGNDGDSAAAALYLEVPLGLVQAAVSYYGAYPDEIDEWITRNEQDAAEAHAGDFGMIFMPGAYRRTKSDTGRIIAALEAKLAKYPGIFAAGPSRVHKRADLAILRCSNAAGGGAASWRYAAAGGQRAHPVTSGRCMARLAEGRWVCGG